MCFARGSVPDWYILYVYCENHSEVGVWHHQPLKTRTQVLKARSCRDDGDTMAETMETTVHGLFMCIIVSLWTRHYDSKRCSAWLSSWPVNSIGKSSVCLLLFLPYPLTTQFSTLSWTRWRLERPLLLFAWLFSLSERYNYLKTVWKGVLNSRIALNVLVVIK